MIELDDIAPEPEAKPRADHGPKRNDDQGEFEIVNPDLARRVTEGFELRDLFPLQPDEPGQHRARHECGDAQERRRKREGQTVQDAQFIIEP